MPALTRSDIEAAARLARLRLDDAEAEKLLADLNAILSFMAVIEHADAGAPDGAPDGAPADLRDGESPVADPGLPPHGAPLRPDVARPSLPPGEAVAGAPEQRDGCFAVPNLFHS